jgi:hypothetical protein
MLRTKLEVPIEEVLEPLSGEEKETIIRFDETQSPADIFTYNKRWIRLLENKLGLKPDMINEYGGRGYTIDKHRIPLPRVPKKMTAEQRKRLSDRASKNLSAYHKKQGHKQQKERLF